MTSAVREPAPARATLRNADGTTPLNTGLRVLRNLSWSCLGSILFFAAIGFLIASLVLVAVLKEIGQKNFTEPMARIDSYATLFKTARAAGCKVEEDKPSLHEGVTTYLWTVQLRGSEDLVVFRWQHDLNTNSITAMSGPAVMADLELGYLSRRDAESSPLFDVEDNFARQAIRLGLGQQPGPAADSGDATASTDQLALPLPPLVNPEDARHRGGGVEEEEEAENPCGGPGTPEETPPGDHTEAGPPQDGGTEDGGGSAPGGGGLDEPSPDPGGTDPGGGEGGGGGDDAVPVR